MARFLPALLAIPAALGQEDAVFPRGGDIGLPAGAIAGILERIGPDVVPAALLNPWPAWDERGAQGWGAELPWRRWVELVRAEARAESPDPRRRAELAVLARLQGRDADAWRHLAAAAGDLATVAALVPLFVPGAPASSLGARALPDGVLLSPALPPVVEDRRGGLRALAGNVLEHRAVDVAGTQLRLRLEVEPDGLEIELVHLAGPPVRVRLAPPLPAGVDAGPFHVDWERRDEGETGPVEFLLSPEKEQREHTLWVAFRRRSEHWPSPLVDTIAHLDRPRSLLVVSTAGDEPHLARFAEALGELFDLPSALVPSPQDAPSGMLEPIVITLGTGAGGERKLAGMIGLAEGFALHAR